LNWTKTNDYQLKSDDGRFAVTRYRVNGEYVYQAIRLPDTSLLVANTADECKAKCEGVG
jgi:hypothetical protein